MVTKNSLKIKELLNYKFGYSYNSEVQLWRMVITQCFIDANLEKNCRKSKTIKYQAVSWLTNKSKDFYDVCKFAEVDPKFISQQVKELLLCQKKGKKFIPKL